MQLLQLLIINLFIGLIRCYQVSLSHFHGPTCRFQPTCSEYFIQSLQAKGIIKGLLRGIWRILRCHPFGSSGYDPV